MALLLRGDSEDSGVGVHRRLQREHWPRSAAAGHGRWRSETLHEPSRRPALPVRSALRFHEASACDPETLAKSMNPRRGSVLTSLTRSWSPTSTPFFPDTRRPSAGGPSTPPNTPFGLFPVTTAF